MWYDDIVIILYAGSLVEAPFRELEEALACFKGYDSESESCPARRNAYLDGLNMCP